MEEERATRGPQVEANPPSYELKPRPVEGGAEVLEDRLAEEGVGAEIGPLEADEP